MGISGYRMEDSDIFMDVKASFRDCVESGMTPSVATKEICRLYKDALIDEDDAVFVWSALVEAQRDVGRQLKSTQNNCFAALERELVRLDKGDIATQNNAEYRKMITDFRAKLVSEPQHPQKRRAPVKCDWKPGDVYALRLSGERARLCGIEGRYLLLRMIQPFSMRRDVFPYVYLSISAKADLPTSTEEISNAQYLCVGAGRQYRIVIVSRTQQEFQDMGFQYVGNYPYVTPPPAQYILPEELLRLYRTTVLTIHLTEHACRLYEHFVLGLDLDTTPYS